MLFNWCYGTNKNKEIKKHHFGWKWTGTNFLPSITRSSGYYFFIQEYIQWFLSLLHMKVHGNVLLNTNLRGHSEIGPPSCLYCDTIVTKKYKYFWLNKLLLYDLWINIMNYMDSRLMLWHKQKQTKKKLHFSRKWTENNFHQFAITETTTILFYREIYPMVRFNFSRRDMATLFLILI